MGGKAVFLIEENNIIVLVEMGLRYEPKNDDDQITLRVVVGGWNSFTKQKSIFIQKWNLG